MNTAQAQISAAISADPERVIALATDVNPDLKEVVAAARAAPGPLSGVAAVAVRYALRGADNAATLANLEAFARRLAEA